MAERKTPKNFANEFEDVGQSSNLHLSDAQTLHDHANHLCATAEIESASDDERPQHRCGIFLFRQLNDPEGALRYLEKAARMRPQIAIYQSDLSDCRKAIKTRTISLDFN